MVVIFYKPMLRYINIPNPNPTEQIITINTRAKIVRISLTYRADATAVTRNVKFFREDAFGREHPLASFNILANQDLGLLAAPVAYEIPNNIVKIGEEYLEEGGKIKMRATNVQSGDQLKDFTVLYLVI